MTDIWWNGLFLSGVVHMLRGVNNGALKRKNGGTDKTRKHAGS